MFFFFFLLLVLSLSGRKAVRLSSKDRISLLMKIADLQQMKKDENTEEEETVHYYLPLQCYRCSLFIADRAKRKAEEAEKPDNI